MVSVKLITRKHVVKRTALFTAETVQQKVFKIGKKGLKLI